MFLNFSQTLQGIDRCPQCNVASPLLTMEWSNTIKLPEGQAAAKWAVYSCSRCKRITLAEGFSAPLSRSGMLEPIGNHIREFYPPPATVDGSLPSDAQRFLRQAIDTKFAPDASIMMAASAVDAMLKAKGYSDGNLYGRIDKAVRDHLLTEDMAKWAHKVRLEANAVRHADQEEDPPSEEDAAKVVAFVKALGDFLYVFAARVEEGLKDAGEGGEAGK